MDSLIIEATDVSPEVLFNLTTNNFIISGKSRPENTGKFYIPIIDWITKFEENLSAQKLEIANNPPIVFLFKLEYFNSVSAKYILDIILMLKDFVVKGHEINIEWHYAESDDDMLDTGTEFSNMVNLKFDFIAH